MLYHLGDHQIVGALVSRNLNVARASITVDRLFDGSNQVLGSDDQRSNRVCFLLGCKLLHVLTPTSISPNVHHYKALEPRSKIHRCTLLPSAERSDYYRSAIVFYPDK